MAGARVYGGLTAAQRAEARRTELLEAALDLVGTSGAERLTVAALCRRAQLNERYFYESFSDRGTVLAALYEQINAEVMQKIMATPASDPADVQVRAAIGAVVDLFDGDRRKARVFLLEDEEIARKRTETVRGLLSFMQFRAAETFGRPDAAMAQRIHLGAVFAVGGFQAALTSWFKGEVTISRAEIIEQTSKMLLALVAAQAGD